jgi:hypothetical protein
MNGWRRHRRGRGRSGCGIADLEVVETFMRIRIVFLMLSTILLCACAKEPSGSTTKNPETPPNREKQDDTGSGSPNPEAKSSVYVLRVVVEGMT